MEPRRPLFARARDHLFAHLAIGHDPPSVPSSQKAHAASVSTHIPLHGVPATT
jgi:hypothetical protein